MRHETRSPAHAPSPAVLRAGYAAKGNQMSKIDILYAVLFVGLFLALWGLAWLLDRVWPSNYERQHLSEKR
jgi:hypothetical protein